MSKLTKTIAPGERKTFTMTDGQLDALLDACKPVPYLVMNGTVPRSPQENANDAWRALGAELGFDWATVEPAGDPKSFTAVALVAPAPLDSEEAGA